MGGFTAETLYGAPPVVEATPSAVPDHAASGHPEPNRQIAARTPGLGNPTLVLVVLLAVAFLLVNVNVRFSGSVSA